MKKAYTAPNIRFSANGSLEGVFASTDQCGNTRTFYKEISGSKVLMSRYCNDANSWMIQVDNAGLYGVDGDEE